MCNVLVFVYGTLKKGHGNHRVLGDSEFLGEYTTADNFILTDCGFPYMVPNTHGEPVSGEVYRVVDPDIMEGLDGLEGVAYGHYEHLEIDVVGLGSKATAYIPCNETEALRYPECKFNEKGEYQWGI